jgi:hypothetical protein
VDSSVSVCVRRVRGPGSVRSDAVELDETTSSEAPPKRKARQGERCWGTRTRITAGLSEGESG